MKNIAMIFPGQGAQFVGMGKELYETSSAARGIFEQANDVIKGLTDVVFNGPEEKLTSTAFCQPGIFTHSVAALKALEESGLFNQIKPIFACGLSLGEYSALVACGALSFEETLRLVERRSFFMEEATKKAKGAMAAIIGFEPEALLKICEKTGVQVANY
ncbi:MAG: ACP S-malonyltransferase, partial [Candidatus Omnitrophica bacterium]|nr:ACP S-malonyltransferase [Candidatus Omnitrophota bacterium]